MSSIFNGLLNAGTKRYLFNTSWMMTEQILRLLVGLFVGLYVARYLGPALFGTFSYALAFVALFGVVAKLGLDGIVVRELVNDPNRRDLVLGTAFWLKGFGGLLVLAVIGTLLPWTGNSTTTNLYILIIAAGLVFDAFEVVDFHFQSIVQSKYVSVCKITQLAISSIVKLALVFAGADLVWFVAVTTLDKVSLAASYLLIAWKKGVSSAFRRLDQSEAVRLLRASWPLILSGLAVIVYMRIDVVMIQSMLGEHEVGIYAAAARISEIWYFVPTVICTSVFPAILSAKKHSKELYRERLRKLYMLLLVLAICVAAVAALMAEFVTVLLYGPAFQAAAAVLRVHIWAGLFVAVGVATSRWFVAEGKLGVATRNTAIGALVNIVLNYFWIPAHGVVGAAMATLVSYAVAAYLLLIFDRSTREIFGLISRSLLPGGIGEKSP